MGRKLIENPDDCSLVHAMNILGGRWKLLILYQLTGGALRFGILYAIMPSISKKVLTEQLRELEQDGLLVRTKYKEMPPRVDYKLSKKGVALIPVLNSLNVWVEDNYAIDFKACKI